ncbi:hypothetical protein [Sphingomonas psychrolutea]|uniref:Flap endonuclease-1-like 5' DNA nuclease n=1 Tax=Sphingomonas psychrolutea TaxID=1259676 RepID=A0ABQ1GBI8_9SPHN|nr:hypothetical protein [Sphingomonas psychrolutea]GGA40575.1 hypothetical protein GCM10011395_08570 [Sphingomonas psychrolutea]
MLFTTPEQFIVLGVLLLGGWLLGYASAPSTKKWKRRVREQSDSFTAYHAEAEDRARAANQRASDLQADLEAIRADHAEAERTIAGLRAAAAAAVAVPVVVAVAEHPALSVVEPEPTRESDVEPAPVESVPMAEVDAAPPEIEPIPEPMTAAAVIALPEHAEAVAITTPEPAKSEPTVEDAVFEPVAPVPMTPTATEAPPAPIGPAEPEMPSKGWFASSARDELTRIRGIDDALNTRLFGLGVVRFEDIEMLSAEDEMALEERLGLPVGTIARDQWRAQAAFFRAGRSNETAADVAAAEPAPVA